MKRLVLLAVACAGCASPELRSGSPTDQAVAVRTFPDGITRLVELGNYHARIASWPGSEPTVTGAIAPFTTYAGAVSPIWGPVTLAAGSLPIPPGGLQCWGDGRLIVDDSRWYATTLGFHYNAQHILIHGLCVLVSKTSDPRQGWWLSFVDDGADIDYPGITRTATALWVINGEDSTTWRFPIPAARDGVLVPTAVRLLPYGVRPAVPRDLGGSDAWFVGVEVNVPLPGHTQYRIVRMGENGAQQEWTAALEDLPDLMPAVNRLPDNNTVSRGGSTTPALATIGGACSLVGAVTTWNCDVFATRWQVCNDGRAPVLQATWRDNTPLCMTHAATTFDRYGTQWVSAMAHGPMQWPQMHLAPLPSGYGAFSMVSSAGLGYANTPVLQMATATTPVFATPGPDGATVRMADYLAATTDGGSTSIWLGGVRGDPLRWYSQTLRIDPGPPAASAATLALDDGMPQPVVVEVPVP